VAFSPNGAWLAMATTNGRVRVRSLRNPDTQPIQFEAAGLVKSITFTPDSRNLVSVGSKGAQLWDLEDPNSPPAVFESQSPASAAFSPDGKRMAIIEFSGKVGVWNLGIAAADYFCTRVSRNLSKDEWRVYVGEGIPYERTCPALPPGVGTPGRTK
jgi:WD40 repeat protein